MEKGSDIEYTLDISNEDNVKRYST